MSSFVTEFPINDKNTVEDVLRLACKWVAGSPHSKIKYSDIDALPVDSDRSYSVEAERVTVAYTKFPEYEIGGLKYVRTENGLEWVTSIVTHKTRHKHLLSIHVTCEALSTAVRLPPPKKPYFIRQALTELGGGDDGEIPVADRPFRLAENEAGVAASLIMGAANNKLPIVYVSAGFDGKYTVDPDELARFVSGMAHVVVEPSRSFSYKVKTLTNARNVFGGTVGIYWPESSARNAYFLGDDARSARAVQLAIAKDIRVALSNRRQRTECTWSHLSEAVARKRYDLLKAQGSTELQEYINAFDTELEAKEARILEAEREISRLNAEVRRLSAAQTVGRGFLRLGKEQDLYEGELTDMVLEIFQMALRNAGENTRRQHLLLDLLEANRVNGTKRRLESEIKSLLKTYRDMDGRTRSALERLGFEISEEGKHYKAIFQGDSRYTFTLPKTSGDHRAGKNTASDICNALF